MSIHDGKEDWRGRNLIEHRRLVFGIEFCYLSCIAIGVYFLDALHISDRRFLL